MPSFCETFGSGPGLGPEIRGLQLFGADHLWPVYCKHIRQYGPVNRCGILVGFGEQERKEMNYVASLRWVVGLELARRLGGG